jgi:hypothetical protein
VTASTVAEVARRVPPDLTDQLRNDPDVVDWLIGVTENEDTKDGYVRQVAKFLLFTGWTVRRLFEIKQEALRRGEPMSEVESKIRQFMEALREKGEYSGKYRAYTLAAIGSLLNSKGFTLKRKLVRVDSSPKLEMRVPERQEVERFIEYAATLEKKLLYTILTDTPCRPRVAPALRWNWLEAKWWEKDVVHVSLPKQFRPAPGAGPRKFEPICFLGPRTVELLKQDRQAKINAGNVPLDTDRIFDITYDGALKAVIRDFNDLVANGLIRPSRRSEQGVPLEQPISPKSWRKYQFNIIDALVDISPEWRKMLKGRDLATEKYYSHENIEALRKIYRDKIYPALWTQPAPANPEKIKELEKRLDAQSLEIRNLQSLARQLWPRADTGG